MSNTKIFRDYQINSVTANANNTVKRTIKNFNIAEATIDTVEIDVSDYIPTNETFTVDFSERDYGGSFYSSNLDIKIGSRTIYNFDSDGSHPNVIRKEDIGDVLKSLSLKGNKNAKLDQDGDYIGTEKNEVHVFGEGNQTIYAYGGNDWIDGGEGDDYIHGGEGDDLILGNDGRDYLAGSQGNDTLIGGAGSDKFAFFNYDNFGEKDTILDFSSNDGDKIRIDRESYGFGANLVKFEPETGDLFVGHRTIATLENYDNFSVNRDIEFV